MTKSCIGYEETVYDNAILVGNFYSLCHSQDSSLTNGSNVYESEYFLSIGKSTRSKVVFIPVVIYPSTLVSFTNYILYLEAHETAE